MISILVSSLFLTIFNVIANILLDVHSNKNSKTRADNCFRPQLILKRVKLQLGEIKRSLLIPSF